MKFGFYIGTRVIFGKSCVKENKAEFLRLGKRALLVTGRRSAKASGAMDDVIECLQETRSDFLVFDQVDNNPTLENVKEGGLKAAEFKADYIVAIGGGSPLDAAKAIAVLAVNPIEPMDLYKNVFDKKPLPIIAIPTTSGTGSEVTPYSILTRHDMETKMSFGNKDTFPELALIDPAYTASLPYDVAVNTAVDALSHAVEGYVSKRSTPLSDILAVEAIKQFGECLEGLAEKKISDSIREKLIYCSLLGGMVISHTGTTIVHGMGYSLTFFKGIPHGRANGLLIAQYLRYIYEFAEEKIKYILHNLGVEDIETFENTMHKLLNTTEIFSEEDFRKYASLAIKQKSSGYNVKNVTEEDLEQIMAGALKKYTV